LERNYKEKVEKVDNELTLILKKRLTQVETTQEMFDIFAKYKQVFFSFRKKNSVF
jgi:hypothetical protein